MHIRITEIQLRSMVEKHSGLSPLEQIQMKAWAAPRLLLAPNSQEPCGAGRGGCWV